HRRVSEDAVSDRALAAAADVVRRRVRVDQRSPEVLATAEGTLESQARANLASRAHLAAPFDWHVARAVAVARAGADGPVAAHFECRREPRGNPATRAECGRRETEQIGRGRAEQRDLRVGDFRSAGGNRADEIEDELAWNHPHGGANIGID